MGETKQRFVLLRHEPGDGLARTAETHWDLMLEEAGVLKTWALQTRPTPSAFEIEALAIKDHRLAYLDFEGPLSDDRGVVTREDAGTWESITSSATIREFRLAGELLRGQCRLQLITQPTWQFTRLS